MTFFRKYRLLFVILALLFLFGPHTVKAVNVGDIVNFNVDKSFDASGRNQVTASLVKVTSRLYFYVEKQWWDSQSPSKQTEILSSLGDLSDEFDAKIYPTLTSLFGFEWNPGIDNDAKITVFFESMNSNEGGYFREDDEYDKLQLPDSNQREMLYLSVARIDQPDTKVILAHEFTHLITFNQKNKKFKVEEETWLNEARSVYSSTILGYDDNYQGSNLQSRVNDFIEDPSDSVTDWGSTNYDYASVDLFTQYLADQYGVRVLSDSLQSNLVGISSINYALSRQESKDDFAAAFTNWTIALAINNCSQNIKYCYVDNNLAGLRVSPNLIFLPIIGNSSLSSTNVTKNWSGNWQKIVGGSGDLKLDFSSLSGLNFQIPYILYDKNNKYSVNFLKLDGDDKGEINVKDFGTNYKSIIIVPSLQAKTYGFDTTDTIYPYTIDVSITGQDSQDDQALIKKLIDQINSLKAQIAALQIKNGITPSATCRDISHDLYFGMSNNNEIMCLQAVLKDQGLDIYPEALVTGNFGNFTRQAVIRFQEKYASDILSPVGLQKGSGYVGVQTRNKVNQILSAGK